MTVTEWFLPPRPCKKFKSHEQLHAGLVEMDNQSILCLQTKALPMVRKVVKDRGLAREQAEEILNESTLIFLQKIENGGYTFQGYAPTTYVVEVAKRLVMAKVRRKPPATASLDERPPERWEDYEEAERQRESASLVTSFLNQLDKACTQVIQLHHIDGYSDVEVIENNWTAYSTIASLKVKRSSCMKKLIAIAQQWKTSTNI